MTLHSYLIYCGVYAVALATPGPGVVAIVARAMRRGFRSTAPAVAGTVVGDWILMTVSALGLALAARTMGGLFLFAKLAGACYLLFLGYRYWNTRLEVSAADEPTADSRRSFVAQLALTVGNPKAIAFFVALLPNVVDLRRLDLGSYLVLSATTVVMIPAIEFSYAACAAKLQGTLESIAARRRLNRFAAVALAAAGVGVAFS